MQTTPITEVPKDFSELKVKGVYNPLKEDVTIDFGGKPHTLKAGSFELHPEPMAFHFAKHLAIKIHNDGIRDFLLENYPGFTEQGREKWRINTTHFISKQDIKDLQMKLVFDHTVGQSLPDMPPAEPKFAGKPKVEDDKSSDVEDASSENLPVPEPEVAKKPSKRGNK